MRNKKYEEWIKQYPEVELWLKNRPENTRRAFAEKLRDFTTAICMFPEEWRSLDKFKARDLAWQYIQTKIKNNPSVAAGTLTALKSFYRYKNGETLPFDSARGGKNYLHVRRKKVEHEHIPSKKEMYQIIDCAGNLRDKSILLFLFQTGCRVNVIQHLKLKHIIDQLDRDTFTLKITPDLDFKLRSRDISFYYTFLNGEGAETLKRYVALAHKKMNPEANLFYTRKSRKAISETFILRIVKNAAKKAGINEQNVWTHLIRKSFRKILRQTEGLDDDDREAFMGHTLPGSRQNYYDSKDIETLLAAYRKCNFMREVPKSEFEKLRDQLTNERTQRALNEETISRMQGEIADLKKIVQSMIDKKA